ncbi:MAG TPA: PepSY domain-containing protein [Caulobacteraceae bacterium]
MKRQAIITLASLAALGLASGAAAAKSLPASETSPAFSGHQLASKAKVTLAQARRTALGARSGTITDEELETEGGGSGLRYSFDVRSGAHTYEVGVDARTGKVLENGREGAHPD